MRLPEDLAYIRVVASGLAADGTNVRDAEVVQAFQADELPSEADLTRDHQRCRRTCNALWPKRRRANRTMARCCSKRKHRPNCLDNCWATT